MRVSRGRGTVAAGSGIRVFGLALLIAGLASELLLLIAAAGGGKPDPAAWLLTGVVAVAGWQLQTFGGIGAPAATPTQEVALTPEHSVLLARAVARRWRFCLILGGCAPASAVLAGVAGDLASTASGRRMLPLLAAVGIAAGALAASGFFLTSVLPLLRDLHEPFVLRTSGPVQPVTVCSAVLVRLPGRVFLVNQARTSKAFAHTRWATVEYSRHARFVFALHDRDGRRIFAA